MNYDERPGISRDVWIGVASAFLWTIAVAAVVVAIVVWT